MSLKKGFRIFERQTLDLRLDVGDVKQQVEVTSQQTQLDLETSARGQRPRAGGLGVMLGGDGRAGSMAAVYVVFARACGPRRPHGTPPHSGQFPRQKEECPHVPPCQGAPHLALRQ